MTTQRLAGKISTSARAAGLIVVSCLAAVVLILTADDQVFDSNFVTVWEAASVLGGDHPYRDFFEWGAPLQVVASVVGQVITGRRLIGELLVHWVFIILGIAISLHLALRLSQSVAASMATMLIAILLLAATPTYHYPKLFLYPMAVWLTWRYMEQPRVSRAAALGFATSVAFLFRHDHGLYVGMIAALALVLARLTVPASRRLRAVARDTAACAATAAAVVTPWLAVVHGHEGVPEYVAARAAFYQSGDAGESPFAALLTMDRMFSTNEAPEPQSAVVRFQWGDVDEAERDALERRYRLRRQQGPDAAGRWEYELPNVHDVDLLTLRSYIDNPDSAEGFDWKELERRHSPVLNQATVLTWLYLMALLVPILVLVSASSILVRTRRSARPIDADTCVMLAAALFLIAIESSLFREPSYFVIVVPLAAGLSATLLRGGRRTGDEAGARTHTFVRNGWSALRWSVAVVLFAVTAVMSGAYARSSGILDPVEAIRRVPSTLAYLTTSPALDAYQPREAARQYDRTAWDQGRVDRGRLAVRYVHDCSRPGDRILVTGLTPFDVSYYAERRIAGGHLYWHDGWRSDPVRERQSLALLASQSVPFAISTSDPVLEDFKRYPAIREHLLTHYLELDGSNGRILVDKRRQPTGHFGALEFPCFQ